MAKAVETTITWVNPNTIRADVNYRFNLIPSRVDHLKEEILRDGGVRVALEVEPLTDDPNGYEYLLVDGYYRHAAVQKANKEGAGLLLPVNVVEPKSDIDRLKSQLSLNLNRESNSPIDSALAMKALMDVGVSRQGIREIFVIKSGKEVHPCSNSHLNIHLNMLKLPKKIQNAIHSGEVGVASAYEIGKAMEIAASRGNDPKAVAETIYEEALAASLKTQAKEEEFEQKILDEEKKAEAEQQRVKEAQAKVDELKAVADKSAKVVTELGEKEKEAFEARMKAQGGDAETYRKADEAFRAAEKARQDAEKIRAKQLKEQKAVEEKAKKLADELAARKKKLEDARAEAKKGAKVDPKAVTKAAAKATGGSVALNAAEMRKVAEDLSLPGSYPKVQAIGEALKSCFAGVMTDGQLFNKLAEITGEREPRKAKAKAAKE